MTEEEIKLYVKEYTEQKKNGFSRWFWFSITEKLAGGDILKFEGVDNQNFIKCLNLLAYWKERDDYQKKLEEQERKK